MNTFRLIAPACLLIAGCVSSGPESQLGKEDKRPKRIEMSRTSDCVFQSTINDFRTIDNRYVVLYASGGRKAYLAEIAGGCFDMQNQYVLAAVDGDRNGQICGFGRDSIAYRRLGIVEDCRILGMEQLSDERRLELGLGVPQSKPRKDEDKDEEKDEQDEKPGDAAKADPG
jgi:Family of unknown function (DUF6491)